MAFTFAHAIAYVQAAIDAGLDVNAFGQRLSFFFNAHNDFLEEIAKFRAARRLWARIMRDRFGATNPRAQQLRFHTQTAGSTLTAQQPDNNIVRVALQAMAAVLGGTQSLHCNGRDEALALPTRGIGARLRCGRSRSSPRRAASRTRSIRSAGRTRSKRMTERRSNRSAEALLDADRHARRHARGDRERFDPARDPGVRLPGAARNRRRRISRRWCEQVRRRPRPATPRALSHDRSCDRTPADRSRPSRSRRPQRRGVARRARPVSKRPATAQIWCRLSSRPLKLRLRWAKSRTRCAACSASIRRRRLDDRRLCSSRAPDDVFDSRAARGRRGRRQLRDPRRRNAGAGRRIGQRQIGDGALDHAPRPAARPHRRRPHSLQRARSADALRAPRCERCAAPRSR